MYKDSRDKDSEDEEVVIRCDQVGQQPLRRNKVSLDPVQLAVLEREYLKRLRRGWMPSDILQLAASLAIPGSIIYSWLTQRLKQDESEQQRQ